MDDENRGHCSRMLNGSNLQMIQNVNDKFILAVYCLQLLPPWKEPY
jgi:hypothetical protein